MNNITRVYKHQNIVHARIHGAIQRCIDEIKEKRGMTDSDVIREALSIYIDRYEDVEAPEPVQKVLNDSQAMNKALAEDYFIENQNFKISTRLKELTFLEFMDKNLSIVYLTNKPHMTEEQLNEHLRATLRTLKDRAEHHGYEHQWKERMENPKDYAEEFLDRKSLESKAFDDLMDSI